MYPCPTFKETFHRPLTTTMMMLLLLFKVWIIILLVMNAVMKLGIGLANILGIVILMKITIFLDPVDFFFGDVITHEI